MLHLTDVDLAWGNGCPGNLCVAFQAEIVVTFDEHLGVDRAVRLVTDGAAFAHRFMFEDEGPRLLAVTLRATFIQASHHQTAAAFVDVHSMGVVALGAVHLAFADRVVLWKIDFGMRFEVALQASGRIMPRIHDQSTASTAGCDVPTARPMTRFATGRSREARAFEVHSGVGAGRKNPGNVGVTLGASVVADERGSGNSGRNYNGALDCRTRNQQDGAHSRPKEQ